MRISRAILQVIATSCLLVACGGTSESNIEKMVPEIKTDVYSDGKGDVINPLGWQIPSLPENRTFVPYEETTSGRKLSVLISTAKVERQIVKLQYSSEGGATEYIVNGVSELRTKSQTPYCYQFTATQNWKDPMKHPGVSVVFTYRDDDGDGIFETLTDRCLTPNWVN